MKIVSAGSRTRRSRVAKSRVLSRKFRKLADFSRCVGKKRKYPSKKEIHSFDFLLHLSSVFDTPREQTVSHFILFQTVNITRARDKRTKEIKSRSDLFYLRFNSASYRKTYKILFVGVVALI